jgi:alcohol dehydrogenase class IV
MQACLEAGLAFSNASLGAVHALSHALGGQLGIPHGLCNALMLPGVVDFNFPAASERFRQIASALGVDLHGKNDDEARAALVGWLQSFMQSLGLTRRLADLGLQRSQIPELAGKASHDPCLVTNPRWPTIEELEELYGRAF